MKTNSKLIQTALIACALVLAFTVCAGCTSSDSTSQSVLTSDEPILGTWKEVITNNYPNYYEFKSDGACILTLSSPNGDIKKYNYIWVKVGENHYQTTNGFDNFYLSTDGRQLIDEWTVDNQFYSDKYVRGSSSEVPAKKIATTASPTKAPTPVPTSSATLGEKNALQSAQSYLRMGGFSEVGLIDQLDYEGFTSSEISYAIKNCGADWNDQALHSAKGYLRMGGFSEAGLMDQLNYEGFTSSQISYAIKNSGANWNDQAAQSAKSYLKMGGFSRTSLKDQLAYEGFTPSQIEYALSANGY